jgi:3-hydroxyisobutyrate dehydrogenase-like beta-hydroxyacid dehydrogenase
VSTVTDTAVTDTQNELKSIALLGTGPMGAPIARNILDAGVPLTLWNRTAEKARAIGGGRVAGTPAEAAAHVVLTVLPDLPQVASLLPGEGGLLAGWKAAGIEEPVLVIHGTVSPVAVARFAEDCKNRHGVTVVDAPLSGGTIGAEEGRLSTMAGGPRDTVQRLLPLFGLYSSTVVWFGEAGAGSTVKACNQIVVSATVTALAEAMAVATATGLDPEKVQSHSGRRAGEFGGAQAEGPALDRPGLRGRRLCENQLKDLNFIAEIAKDAGLELPLSASVRGAFELMVDAGDGDLDHTGIYRTILGEPGHASRQ